ncbi:MAG: ACP S-malonyltransferase [Janthinobacterium lividum]
MNRAFIFPGQGSQIIGMGKDFYNNFSSAKETFLEVDDALQFKLSNIIFNGSDEELTLTTNAQPALMTVSMAIINTLRSETGQAIDNLCNIVAGHSLGEYSALCAVGTLSLRDAATLLQVRSRSMQEACAYGIGAMAACLAIDIKMLEKIIEDNIISGVCQVANDNMIGQIVISGHESNINTMIKILKAAGYRAIKLKVSAPFHSELMRPAEIKMIEALDKVTINIPQVPIISNVTAAQATAPIIIKDNLINQICGRVRWRETMDNLSDLETNEIIEIGSGKVLTNMLKKIDSNVKATTINNIEELKGFLHQNF